MYAKDRNSVWTEEKKRRYRQTVEIDEVVAGEFYFTWLIKRC